VGGIHVKKRLSIPIAGILCILILASTNISAIATSSSQDNKTVNSSSDVQDHASKDKAAGNPHNKAVWCKLYLQDLGEISDGSFLSYLHWCTKHGYLPGATGKTPPKPSPIISPVSFELSNINSMIFGIIQEAFATITSTNIIQVNNDPVTLNGTKRTQSESSIAVSGSNIVVGYNDNQDPNTSTYSGYSYSNDGGKTWTDGGGILPNPGDFDANDPSVKADSKGNFYDSMLVENGTFTKVGVAKSTDGGKTFSSPVIVDSVNASATPAFIDKEYLYVGKNPTNPSQDIIHIAYTKFTTSAAEIIYKRSLDGGITWQDSCTLNPGGDSVGAMPLADPTGNTVYIFYMDFTSGSVVGWKNTNAGAGCIWTKVTNVGIVHPMVAQNVCGGTFALWNGNHRATQIPVEAIGPNGNIYVTWNDSPDGKTTQIVLYRSQDGGVTWTGPVTFNPTQGRDQFEPWIAVAPNGKITLIFYDRVNDPNNLKLDLYAATSTDNGNTWQPNQRITPSSSSWGTLSPSPDPYYFYCYFIGDYQSITFDANNVANIVWTDGHVIASDGTPKPNVYYTQLVSGSVPAAPTGLTTTGGNAQVSLSWTAPSSNGGSAITGYEIERSTDSGTTWSAVVPNTGTTGTTYSDTGLAPSTAYTYRVLAINSIGTSQPSNTASATTSPATTYSITKVQSGLLVSDLLKTGNTADLTFGGTATQYNYYEDSLGLHIGVQSPTSGNWVNYFADTPQADGLLYHVRMTIPETSVADGVFNPSLYVEGSNFIPHVGCGGYADSTGYYWAVGQSYDAGKTYTMLYISNPSSLPHTQDCTIITNGDNYLKVYIGGKLVYSNSSMSLGISRPFVTFVQDDTSSSMAMHYATFSNYYITTDEKIQVTNIPSNAVTASVVGSTGKILASSSVTAGTATLNVGMYNFPLSANINIYDSNNALIASSPARIYGGDVFSVTH
jgi:prepilin-type processing-associated H-X9-DG protein